MMKINSRHLAAFLALSASLACATTGPSVPVPPNIADGLNLEPHSADQRALSELLIKLIQADTSNPPGNEGAAVAVLAAFFKAHGIPTKTISAPGLEDRPILRAHLKASRRFKKPMLLLGHTDVVPADPKAWKNGIKPFGGRQQDGYIWGRGALDMKGMLAVEAMSLVLIKRHFMNSESHKLERDLFFVATPDEEDQGLGAQYVADNMEKLFGDHPEMIINEGGIGLRNLIIPGQDLWAVSVAERGNVWIEVTVKGDTGHGSQAWSGFASQRLIEGLTRLRESPFPIRLNPATLEMLRRAAPAAGLPKSFFMGRAMFVKGALSSQPATNASVRNTCIETALQAGGPRPNVIPPKATAMLDCRVLPDEDPQTMVEALRARLAIEGVELKVRSMRPGSQSVWTSPLFGAFERHLPADGKQVVVPVVSPGSTDSAWFRGKDVPYVYGILPFMIDVPELKAIHGINERIAESELHAGLGRMVRIIADVAGTLRPKFKD
jgi:acetylornithine deacetylase/succinyl-diaminopimelate desuccinylase-like protein